MTPIEVIKEAIHALMPFFQICRPSLNSKEIHPGATMGSRKSARHLFVQGAPALPAFTVTPLAQAHGGLSGALPPRATAI
jgi:hypothetical protein